MQSVQIFVGETMGVDALEMKRRTCRNKLSRSGLLAPGAGPEHAPLTCMDFLARLFAYDVMRLRPAFDDDLLQRAVMPEQQDHVSWVEPLVRLNSCVAVWTLFVDDSLLLGRWWPHCLLLEFFKF